MKLHTLLDRLFPSRPCIHGVAVDAPLCSELPKWSVSQALSGGARCARDQLVSDHLTALHHELHSLKLGDVGQRVA